MIKKSLLVGSILAVGACSYTLDKQIQEVEIVTPGAHNAICYAYVEGLRYKYRPPQTITIAQSREDLIVDCLAPGNRRKKVVIEPYIPKSFFGNVANGAVPGATWDYASDAMFKYPSIIEVNFVNTPTTPEALPAQNQPDIKQPEQYNLEEFRPGLPRLNSDKYAIQHEASPRQRATRAQPHGPQVMETIVEGYDAGKSAPAPVASPPPVDSFGENMNPSGEPTPYGPEAPIPLYPGE